MLLKKKNNSKKITLKHFTKNEIDLDKYFKSQSFTWQKKTIKVLSGHRQESLYPYLGIHTTHGIFYMQNGIPWLQNFTDIFAEHPDIETQDWLLSCALDKIDNNIFWPIQITGLSIHNAIEQNLVRLILKNISNNNIYASQKDWLNMFSQLSFNQSKNFNIDKIPLKRNIILGKQKLNYKQYSNLRIGNVILLNKSNFNLDSIGLFNIGSFAMEIYILMNK